MTIEEKAQAYDEALERAKDVYTYYSDDTEQLRKIESIFPELKESGDERIRKELIAHCENLSEMFHIIDKKEDFVKYQSWINWLEKQGEHYKFMEKIQVGDNVTRNEDGVLVNLSQLKRVAKPAVEGQGEQKSAITPKFKVEEKI